MVQDNFKILVVEDEPIIRNIFTSFLTRKNYNVLAASTAEEALDLIKTHSPDLMLLDLNLPLMSGIELLQTVRCFNKALRVFVVSGMNIDYQEENLLHTLDVTRFFVKPVVMPDLEEAIDAEGKP